MALGHIRRLKRSEERYTQAARRLSDYEKVRLQELLDTIVEAGDDEHDGTETVLPLGLRQGVRLCNLTEFGHLFMSAQLHEAVHVSLQDVCVC